jgi:hypothetical protein
MCLQERVAGNSGFFLNFLGFYWFNFTVQYTMKSRVWLSGRHSCWTRNSRTLGKKRCQEALFLHLDIRVHRVTIPWQLALMRPRMSICCPCEAKAPQTIPLFCLLSSLDYRREPNLPASGFLAGLWIRIQWVACGSESVLGIRIPDMDPRARKLSEKCPFYFWFYILKV